MLSFLQQLLLYLLFFFQLKLQFSLSLILLSFFFLKNIAASYKSFLHFFENQLELFTFFRLFLKLLVCLLNYFLLMLLFLEQLLLLIIILLAFNLNVFFINIIVTRLLNFVWFLFDSGRFISVFAVFCRLNFLFYLIFIWISFEVYTFIYDLVFIPIFNFFYAHTFF